MIATSYAYEVDKLSVVHRADIRPDDGGVVILQASGLMQGANWSLSVEEAQDLASRLGETLEVVAKANLAKSVLHPSAKGAPVVELGS